MQEEYNVPSSEGATLTDPTRCPQCGKPLIGLKSTQKYCNRECYRKYWSAHIKPKLHARRDAYWAQKHGTRTSEDYQREEERESDLWLARSRFWLEENDSVLLKGSSGHVAKLDPIILTGHGVQLRTEREALVIRDGFTHYPQGRQEWRLYPGREPRPSRILLLDTDGYISLNVMQWLARNRVPLVALNWQGEVVTCIGTDSMAADLKLRQVQLSSMTDGVGLRFSVDLIRRKITAAKRALKALYDERPRKRAAAKLEQSLAELDEPIPDVESLRMIEARAACSYFEAWQSLPMRWKGTGRHPIPMDWLLVGQRGSLVSGTNRNATHPTNALLNYAYGILESQVQIAAVTAGFDPAIGFLHACKPGRVALIYDLMEPLRPLVDHTVLDLLRLNTFTPSDFLLTPKGVCRLHPQMARKVASLALDDNLVRNAVEHARLALISLAGEEPARRAFKRFG